MMRLLVWAVVSNTPDRFGCCRRRTMEFPGWGLHPALRDSIYPLWARREIAFVPFAGTSDDLTRSHFETQDTIELGQSTGGSRDYRSGFMRRLSGGLKRAQAVFFPDQL